MTRGSVDTRTPAERSVLEVARPGPEVMCWFTPTHLTPSDPQPQTLQQVHSEKKKGFQLSFFKQLISWNLKVFSFDSKVCFCLFLVVKVFTILILLCTPNKIDPLLTHKQPKKINKRIVVMVLLPGLTIFTLKFVTKSDSEMYFKMNENLIFADLHWFYFHSAAVIHCVSPESPYLLWDHGATRSFSFITSNSEYKIWGLTKTKVNKEVLWIKTNHWFGTDYPNIISLRCCLQSY